MSCWCGLDCRLLSGILPRSVAPHSWTHSDTMLEDGMDHGYMEAADTWTQGFVTNIYIWLCVCRHWICSRNKDGIKVQGGRGNKETQHPNMIAPSNLSEWDVDCISREGGEPALEGDGELPRGASTYTKYHQRHLHTQFSSYLFEHPPFVLRKILSIAISVLFFVRFVEH